MESSGCLEKKRRKTSGAMESRVACMAFQSQPEYILISAKVGRRRIMSPTAWDFQNRLMAILNGARKSGQSYVDVESANLHKEVGGYPNLNDRMPVCCEVMRRLMRAGDSVVKEPTSEQGATLIIRYTVSAAGTPQHKNQA
jgi:5-methylcytosine-specific restriction protein A